MAHVLEANDQKSPTIVKIWQEGGSTLGVQWDDGEKSAYDVVALREQCPCAYCVDEWSGVSKIRPGSIPRDVKPVHINPVGRYALNIQFSDGHDSGFYTFGYLKKLSKLDSPHEGHACSSSSDHAHPHVH